MLEKLLLAVDQSEHSRKAIPATIELARAGGGTVHVLHVRELFYPVPPTVRGDSAEEAERLVGATGAIDLFLSKRQPPAEIVDSLRDFVRERLAAGESSTG